MTDAEPNFEDDKQEMQEAINQALNELTDVKAYTLTVEELRDFKAAQYALRNLSEDKGPSDQSVSDLYEARVEVRGDESDY